jgi:hypothetical protein
MMWLMALAADSEFTPVAMPFQPPWGLWDLVGLAGIAWVIVTGVLALGGHGCGASVAGGALMALAVVVALVATQAGW